MSKTYNLPCNIARTLDIIGDRWTLLIVRDLLLGKRTFGELKDSLEGISPNILSERLRSLEEHHIIQSRLYSTHPPRYEYLLTEQGRELRHVIHAIAIWGNHFLTPQYHALIDPRCGHEVQQTYRCPECGNVTDEVRYIPVR